LLAAGETCHDTQTTNLKDKYFGFAGKTLAVLDGVEEILDADGCVSAIQDAVITVGEHGDRETVTVRVILLLH